MSETRLPELGRDFVLLMQADPIVRVEIAHVRRAQGEFDALTAEFQAWLFDGYTPSVAALDHMRGLLERERTIYDRMRLAQEDLVDACIDFVASLAAPPA
jgi:hypothetical protein